MKAGIHMRVVYTDENLVELWVEASNGVFSGQTCLYADSEGPRMLAAALRGFPAAASDAREFELGTFKTDFAGGGLSLRFYCVDHLGHAAVEICLQARESPMGTENARFRVPVVASDVDMFVEQLAAMSGVLGDEAWLGVARG